MASLQQVTIQTPARSSTAPATVRADLLPARDAQRVAPVSWWVWALCLATVADRTTNPLLLVLVLAVAGFVVVGCRSRQSWAPGYTRGFGAFLRLGLAVLVIRVLFHLLLGVPGGGPVIARLPVVHLPSWFTGIRLGGPVDLGGLLGTLWAAAGLAVLLCCVGAAVVLADPRRLLAALPGALYEVGVAVVVGVSMAPELLAGARRIRRAQQLRGNAPQGRGLLRRARGWLRTAMPLLADATDHALVLAASMDARGYGRDPGSAEPGRRRASRLTGALVLLGLCGLCVGAYGLLDTSTPWPVTVIALAVGGLAAVAGLTAGSRRVHRTRYRTQPWGWPDALAIGSGLLALAGSIAGGMRDQPLYPSPLELPPLPVLPFLGVLLAALPGLVLTGAAAGDTAAAGGRR